MGGSFSNDIYYILTIDVGEMMRQCKCFQHKSGTLAITNKLQNVWVDLSIGTNLI